MGCQIANFEKKRNMKVLILSQNIVTYQQVVYRNINVYIYILYFFEYVCIYIYIYFFITIIDIVHIVCTFTNHQLFGMLNLQGIHESRAIKADFY